jgi:hypothetical protein
MFVYKNTKELEAMTPEQLDAYKTEMRTHEKSELSNELKSELSKAQETLKDFLAKEVSNQLLEQTSKGIEKVKSLEEEIKEKKEALLKVAKGETKEAVVLKADTNRASIPNNQQAVDLPNVGQLATRKLSLYDIFPKVRVSSSNHNGTIRYYDWDEATIARAAASVAEGAPFPESTAKFKKGSVVIEKIGDTLPVTEEFFEDEAMFASELGLFLDTNVQLVVDNQLCNGTGASNTLVGLYQSSPAYTPVASGIADANIYDLVIKVSEDITTTGGSKYMPNAIIARKSVINQMKLKKDGENNYILPPFVSADGRNVDGMVVIESNIAPANTLVVCDTRFAKIYETGGVELSTGLVGDQFIEDAMTLKARKRLAFLIREADKGGFRKVTSISAALTTLAS